MLLQFLSAIHRVYLCNYRVSGWYLKYRFRLKMKQNVIIEQNNIWFNRNMLMLGCVTWPSWQRLALSLNKCPEAGIFWQAVKCQGHAFVNLDHRFLWNAILYGTCIKQWVWFKGLILPPTLKAGSQGLEWGQDFSRKLKLQDLTLQGSLSGMLLDRATLTTAV